MGIELDGVEESATSSVAVFGAVGGAGVLATSTGAGVALGTNTCGVKLGGGETKALVGKTVIGNSAPVGSGVTVIMIG